MPVREGMVGEVQLVTTGEFNETFTINLTFTPITAGELTANAHR